MQNLFLKGAFINIFTLFLVIFQCTGRLIVVNIENEPEKDKDMVQCLMGMWNIFLILKYDISINEMYLWTYKNTFMIHNYYSTCWIHIYGL